MSHGHVASSSTSGTGADPSTKALVLEFLCLYTHDIKRKNQKRWQDARLKYHTFNKRIVVHDIRGNYVGDAHWSGGHDEFGDGEELMLDRGGVLVQVCEEVGKREQDLGELLDKRAKEVEARRVKAANTPRIVPRPTDNVHFQLIQRPLSGILQQASPAAGRIGRAAVPRESPYEVRLRDVQGQQKRQEEETPPPSKKRRCDESPPAKSGHARALFGTQLTLSARPMSTPFSRSQQYQPLHDRTNMTLPSSERDKDRHTEGARTAAKSTTSAPSRVKTKPSPALQAPDLMDLSGSDAENSDQSMNVDSYPAALGAPKRSKERSRPASKKPPVEARNPEPLTSEAAGGVSCKQPRKASVDKPSSTNRGRKRRGSTSDKQPEDQVEGSEAREVPSYITESAKSVESGVSTRARDEKHKANKRLDASKANSRHRERNPDPPNPDVVDLEEDAKQNAEPRTELRIRPRKKRGLLMLSEKLPPIIASEESLKPAEQQSLKEQTPNQSFDEWLLGDTECPENQSGYDRETAGKSNQLHRTQKSKQSPVPIPPGSANPVPILEIDDPNSPPRPSDSHMVGNQTVRQTGMLIGLDQNAPRTKTRHRSSRNERSDRDGIGEDDGGVPSGNSSAICAKSAKNGEQTTIQLHELEATNTSNPLPTIEDDESHTDSRKKQRDQHSPSPVETDGQPELKSKRSASSTAKDEAASNGPRIVKMARRSVKSKEIFGLQLPRSDCSIPAELATASTRLMPPPPQPIAQGGGESPSLQARPAGNGMNGGGSNHQSPEGTNIMQDKDRAHEPTCKLTNPATKGKKAASKADAAGLAPQSLVLFDTVPQRRPGPAAPAPSRSVSNAKGNATLPGFSTANGGAWSKHAEDLLGMARPKRRGGPLFN